MVILSGHKTTAIGTVRSGEYVGETVIACQSFVPFFLLGHGYIERFLTPEQRARDQFNIYAHTYLLTDKGWQASKADRR